MADRRKAANTGMLFEMDSTLELCTGLTEAIETLGGKHKEASLRMKAHKERTSFLEQKIAALKAENEELSQRQQELKQAYQTARTAQKKTKEDCDAAHSELNELQKVKKELESMKEVFSSFKAKQKERIKNVLERMTVGADGKCVQLHLDAWSTDLEDKKSAEKLAVQLGGAEGALKDYQLQRKEHSRRVLERMLAGQSAGLLLSTCAAWRGVVAEEKELRDAEARLKAVEGRMTDMQREKKEQSKAVMSRLLEAQDSELLRSFFALWISVAQQEKAAKGAQQQLKEREKRLAEVAQKKKHEAFSVLVRMTGNVESSVVEEVFSAWAEHTLDAKSEREFELTLKAEAEKVAHAMRQKKVDAQHVLERTLAASALGTCQLVLKYWRQAVLEEVNERRMVAQAESQLKHQQHIKRGQAMSVVERMVVGQDKAMTETVLSAWGQVTMEERTRREVETNLLAEKQAYVEGLRQQLEELLEDVEDTQEEVDESKHKTLQLKGEFSRLKELEELMEESLDSILAPSRPTSAKR